MTIYPFLAIALDGETDRNKVAAALGITRKLTWEEPLVLSTSTLELRDDCKIDDQRAYLYSFGSAVFFNCTDQDVAGFFSLVSKRTGPGKLLKPAPFKEKYALRINEGERISATNDVATLQQGERVYIDIIASVLAKSVALEQL